MRCRMRDRVVVGVVRVVEGSLDFPGRHAPEAAREARRVLFHVDVGEGPRAAIEEVAPERAPRDVDRRRPEPQARSRYGRVRVVERRTVFSKRAIVRGRRHAALLADRQTAAVDEVLDARRELLVERGARVGLAPVEVAVLVPREVRHDEHAAVAQLVGASQQQRFPVLARRGAERGNGFLVAPRVGGHVAYCLVEPRFGRRSRKIVERAVREREVHRVRRHGRLEERRRRQEREYRRRRRRRRHAAVRSRRRGPSARGNVRGVQLVPQVARRHGRPVVVPVVLEDDLDRLVGSPPRAAAQPIRARAEERHGGARVARPQVNQSHRAMRSSRRTPGFFFARGRSPGRRQHVLDRRERGELRHGH
mmetsp:Transcript_21159/g.84327  ORF Transcript_21159/g.84327 Transcript_21159/m.84327 type:complete len:364 (-) Transcript_21159:237-1328(-)